MSDPVGTSARGSTATRTPGSSPAGRCSSTTCTCPACCTWRFCAADDAHARLRRIDVAAARARPGVVAVYTAADLGDVLAARTAAGAAAADCRASSSTSAPRCRSRATRSATPASRWRWWWPRAATSPRTRWPTSRVDVEPLPASWSTSKRRCGPARRACTTTSARTWPRTCAQTKGDYAAARADAAHRHPAPLPLRPRRRRGDREPRRRGAAGTRRTKS